MKNKNMHNNFSQQLQNPYNQQLQNPDNEQLQNPDNQLELLEALNELYSGSNRKDPFKLKQAEHILLEFQKKPRAFITSLEFLNSKVNH